MTVLTFRTKARVELRAAYTPDAARAVSGHLQLIPEEVPTSGSDIV